VYAKALKICASRSSSHIMDRVMKTSTEKAFLDICHNME
jgi:hypothetical protein